MKTGIRNLTRRICALVLALWLVLLVLLTWAVAQDFQNQLYQLSRSMVRSLSTSHHQLRDVPELPGYGSFQQIMALDDAYVLLRTDRLLPVVLDQLPHSYSSNDWFYGKWDLLYGFQPALVFFDEAGEPLVKSGNLLILRYTSSDPTAASEGLAYIDLGKITQGKRFLENLIPWEPFSSAPSAFSGFSIRSTGYFEGDEFIPVTLDTRLSDGSIPGSSWEYIIDKEPPAGVTLVTIHSDQIGGFAFDATPVSRDGIQYASLVELALDSEGWLEPNSLLDCTFVLSGQASPYTEASRFRLAIHAQPLGYALWRMIPVYLWGSLAVGLCLWWLLRYLRNNLTRPLANVAHEVQSGYPVNLYSQWKEVRQMEEFLQQAQNQTHALQNEAQQLRTSLDYAKHAEENRRQLVSNITHELKTPLAVIHSYAEGLQAGIAAGKEDYYLNTILTETEKMDAMVLEMLDFSRLEAGKVRLRTDHFSLLALTQEILRKLAPEEHRVHAISFGYCNDCMITADESRMTQVVTNLLSNALRYTAEGEEIHLRVFSDPDWAHFQIENRASHLSEEALEKIFDSFYRADEARSEKGTGLGLPIARNIIQLHRGTLTARNTWIQGKTYLEFAFQLPIH